LAIQAGMIEAREGVIMTYGAIKTAVELSKRYIPDRLLPGKAIDLLSETAVEVRRRGAGSVLRDEDVMEVITEKTGIPLTNINANEAEKLLQLEENLHSRVIGQEQAIKSVASAIRRVRVGMKMQNRPVGTFLFLGPTGVGKTELAKALAEVYYGDENAMIRLDMSEYQTVSSVEKLIGYSSSDSGDTGSGGILTEAVKHKPFSLILLDELEKANKNVLNVFLQVFDDGRLTDNLGRTVDFTNCIIIATSNAGSAATRKIFVDEKTDNARIFEMIEPYLLQFFAPEFLNRFTDKIIFRSLTQQDLSSIARLQIKNLAARLDKAQGIKIDISEDAISYLVDAGYSAEYGARYLQRTMQEKLENLIAVKFLKGDIKRGQTFRIEAEDLKSL
jgi:ATP-dependent Clp protease ATP-binding subunit ClpA